MHKPLFVKTLPYGNGIIKCHDNKCDVKGGRILIPPEEFYLNISFRARIKYICKYCLKRRNGRAK